MKKWTILALAAVLGACGSGQNQASDEASNDSGIRQAFAESFATLNITDISPSPVEGLYAVEVNGQEVVYATEDGQYVFTGDLLQLQGQQVVNVAEQRFETVRADGIKSLDKDQLVSFEVENEKAALYVFTDITCGYCRRLHEHMDEFNDMGVSVHYLAFPRGGAQHAAADALRHIWCAEDQQQGMTDAKLNNQVPESQLGDCAAPVSAQLELGRQFGVRGTPAIYNAEGQQLGGYLNPMQLRQRLGL